MRRVSQTDLEVSFSSGCVVTYRVVEGSVLGVTPAQGGGSDNGGGNTGNNGGTFAALGGRYSKKKISQQGAAMVACVMIVIGW